ncbi:glycosyltransferase family 4 protein [Streptomyces sp. LN245]|uniref:glycosyltransferase family 4 protein n=1 Tax=Streptomyces sp. LN245 TaxID=3112975 RepID=UPI003711BFA3
MPLRVLLLTSAFAPTMGGAESYARTVAHGLADAGHDVLVVTDTVPGTPPREADGPVRIIRLGGYRGLLEDPSKLPWEQLYFGLLPELADVVTEFGPDLVLANSLETTVAGRVVADELAIPLVGAYHEHAPLEEPLGIGKTMLGYRRMAPDLVLAGSHSYAARALAHLPAERVALVHHGVDTDAFTDAPHTAPLRQRVRARYGIADDDLLVVCAGRLKPRKGQLELVEAFASLGHPGLRLLLVGGVSSASRTYADRLRAQAASIGAPRLQLDESVTVQQMPGVLAAADIVAQPSHSEGLGLSLLEAMSAARPVIATRIDGFDEVLTEEGLALRVDPEAPGQLASALATLCADGDLRRGLGRRARAHVLARFSQRRMIDRTAELLCRLAVPATARGTR